MIDVGSLHEICNHINNLQIDGFSIPYTFKYDTSVQKALSQIKTNAIHLPETFEIAQVSQVVQFTNVG